MQDGFVQHHPQVRRLWLVEDGLSPDPRRNQIRQRVSIDALALASEQRLRVTLGLVLAEGLGR